MEFRSKVIAETFFHINVKEYSEKNSEQFIYEKKYTKYRKFEMLFPIHFTEKDDQNIKQFSEI